MKHQFHLIEKTLGIFEGFHCPSHTTHTENQSNQQPSMDDKSYRGIQDEYSWSKIVLKFPNVNLIDRKSSQKSLNVISQIFNFDKGCHR